MCTHESVKSCITNVGVHNLCILNGIDRRSFQMLGLSKLSAISVHHLRISKMSLSWLAGQRMRIMSSMGSEWALNGDQISACFHIIHDTRQLNLLKHLKDAVSISSEPKSTCTDGLQDEGAFGSEKHLRDTGHSRAPRKVHSRAGGRPVPVSW